MSVKRLNREVDSAELAEWMAFAQLEPFGPLREDQRSGVIAAVLANVNRDPAKRSKPYDVEDFFPTFETMTAEPPEPEPATLQSKLTAWAMSLRNNAGKRKKEKPNAGRAVEAGEAVGDGQPDRLARRGRRRTAKDRRDGRGDAPAG